MEDYEVLLKNSIYYKKVSKAFPLDAVREILGSPNLDRSINENQTINNNENVPNFVTGIRLQPKAKTKKIQPRRIKKQKVQRERAQKPVYDFIND
ncbi:hypothetical protein SteCoe_20567 [Stentor coeruleus]|uniref:Uncharacterized protein n=1 Tax=Stentor coeruleus TaxID=5963 RepID=A0A1R2BRF9_9CILI|nr:hypothetical protein SteCoe_20567 [Stentor coeruleus]